MLNRVKIVTELIIEAIVISLIQHFEADFLWSQPQNPEFRINPENFHPCRKENSYKVLRFILITVTLVLFHYFF